MIIPVFRNSTFASVFNSAGSLTVYISGMLFTMVRLEHLSHRSDDRQKLGGGNSISSCHAVQD